MNTQLPASIEQVFSESSTPDAVFSALLPALTQVLGCDRCFLYLRNPHSRVGKIAYCWRRSSKYPDVLDSEWKVEQESFLKDDPLFTAALNTKPSIFVEDVETADPKVVNKDFEAKNFGHRALIHAHLCSDGNLWGILQPCIFDSPRIWTEEDHQIINTVVDKITPLAVAYVQAAKV